MTRKLMILAAAVLAGCSTSGAIPMADGVYMVSSQNAGGIIGGGASGAQRRAMEVAVETCAKQGKKPYLIDAQASQGSGAFYLANAQANVNRSGGQAYDRGVYGNTIGAGSADVLFGCR